MVLAPRIEGRVAIQSAADRFVEALRRRVAAGLLSVQPHPRSRYRVSDAGKDRLRIDAVGWWTALNVGLNEWTLDLTEPGVVRYGVRFWRWAAYGVGLSALLGIIGVVLLLTLDVRGYIADHVASRVPGLSVDQNLTIAWAMAFFWGFVWPWLLIALHKRPLHKLVARIVAEVDGDAAGVA